jgi:hypothetical protein
LVDFVSLVSDIEDSHISVGDGVHAAAEQKHRTHGGAE